MKKETIVVGIVLVDVTAEVAADVTFIVLEVAVAMVGIRVEVLEGLLVSSM